METINEFLMLLEKNITNLLSHKQAIIEQNMPEKSELHMKIDNINKILSEPEKSIKLLTKNLISREYCSEKEYNDYLAIISFINVVNYIPGEYKETLLLILNNILEKMNSKLNSFNDFSNSETEEYDRKINFITKLKKKIISLDNIQEEDLDHIIAICKNHNLEDEFITNLLADIALSSMDKIYMDYDTLFGEEKLDVQVIELNEIVLTDKELEDLFSEYNYKFDYFSTSAKSQLKSYGNINNIRSILDVFKSFGVDLNVPYKKGNVFTSAANSLCKIFLYSNADYVKNALQNAKQYGILEDLENGFPEYIKNSSVFFPRRRRYLEKHYSKKRKSGPTIDEPKKENYKKDTSGALEDFSLNMSLMFDIYKQSRYGNQDIDEETEKRLKAEFRNEIYYKHPVFFIASYEKHLNIVNQFNLYGIDSEKYLNCLSSFKTTDFVDKLDQFIELDCYDYIKDNLSSLAPNVKPDILSKIKILKQILNCSNEEIFDEHKDSVKGEDEKKLVLKKNYTDGMIYDSKKRVDDLDTYIIPDQLKDRFDYLYKLLNKEYKSTESTFFNKYDSRIELLNASISNYPFYDTLNNEFLDAKNSLMYRINGIPVSKYKVQRIYDIFVRHNISDSFENLLFAITYNSCYTQEQFDAIKTGLNKTFNGGEINR